MNTIIKQLKKIFLISCIAGPFLISVSIAKGEEAQGRQFRLSGFVRSVTNVESFVLRKGEKSSTLYVTSSTVYKNMENNTASFRQLIQPGKFVLVVTEIIAGRYVAISVREISEG